MATTSNDIAIHSDTAIRSDIAIAVAFIHAQWLSSVQKRRANRAVHLGKSQTRQPQLTFSQF